MTHCAACSAHLDDVEHVGLLEHQDDLMVGQSFYLASTPFSGAIYSPLVNTGQKALLPWSIVGGDTGVAAVGFGLQCDGCC